MTDQTAVPPVPGIVDLHARLAAGETLFGTFAGLGSPVAIEMMARAGFDWLIIDLEHGAGTEAELLASLHAMGATPTAALVRPQSGERLRIGRALDLGAHGIMVPRVDLPEQAREADLVHALPAGWRARARARRRAGPVSASSATRRSRRSTAGSWASSRSSRASAVEHAAEIAAIDGVDVLFVGPTDLSHSLGVPGRFDDPGYLDALRHVVDDRRGGGQGRRDPAARRVVAAAPPRPRVPVHRARLGRGVHRRWRRGPSCPRRAPDARAGPSPRPACLSPRPPPRAASPARALRAVSARSGR